MKENIHHYITIITVSFLAVFAVLAKVLLIDFPPQAVEKTDPNSKNHYYQGTVERVKGSCSCKDLVSKDGRGNCKGAKVAKEGKVRVICYVNQPSYCSDLEDSDILPGEKHSAAACLSKDSGCLHCYDHRFGKGCKSDSNDNSICVTLDERYFCSENNATYKGPCQNWGYEPNKEQAENVNSEEREAKAVESINENTSLPGSLFNDDSGPETGGEQDCISKDSDSCLQKSPGWSTSYTCASSKGYCTRWIKDLKRCCPKTCKNTKPFSEYDCRVAKGKGSCTYPNDAQCPVIVSLEVGDVVRMSNFKSVVEKSFEGTSYAWSDQMRSMLGKDFPVLEIRDDGIIALPSPNGQQNGKWYFHQRAVRKINAKSVQESTTEKRIIERTEMESAQSPPTRPAENKPLDVGPLTGPTGNAIDISPDGLSELTFGQLLVLFSKIDQAKKQAAAAGSTNSGPVQPGAINVEEKSNRPPTARCSCSHCFDNRYNRNCKRDSKNKKTCVTYNEIYLCSTHSMTFAGPCDCKEPSNAKNSLGSTDTIEDKKKIIPETTLAQRPTLTLSPKHSSKKVHFTTTKPTKSYFSTPSKTTKDYFSTTFRTNIFKKDNTRPKIPGFKNSPRIPATVRTKESSDSPSTTKIPTTLRARNFERKNTAVATPDPTTTPKRVTTEQITTTLEPSTTTSQTKYFRKTNFRELYTRPTTAVPSASLSTLGSTSVHITTTTSIIEKTTTIKIANHANITAVTTRRARIRVPVLRITPRKQPRINEAPLRFDNNEKGYKVTPTAIPETRDIHLVRTLQNSTGYYFYGGCEEGKSCLNGKICGTLTACRKCSLDDCRLLAENRGSFAFSYRGTSHRWCRMCDQSSFANHVSDHDWGIYTKHDFNGKECFNIGLTTRLSANEISWEIGGCKNYIDNKGYGNNQFYQQICCLKPGNYELRCKNFLREGWNGAYVEINGQKCCEHFRTGTEQVCDVTIAAGRGNLGFKGLKDPLLCNTLQDGLYNDPENCTKMFWCSNGQMSRLTCPAGLLFDTSLGVCNFFMESNRCVLGTIRRVKTINKETSRSFQYTVSPYQSLPT